jgi:FtsH-binding integral membrane protein
MTTHPVYGYTGSTIVGVWMGGSGMAGRTNNSLSQGTNRIGMGVVIGLVLAIAVIIAVGDTALAGAVVSLGVAVGAGLAIGAVAGEVVNRHNRGNGV